MAYDGASPKPDQARIEAMFKRSETLFVAQRQHAMLWQSLAEIFYPERADFISQRTGGAERYEGLFDTEPQIMRRDLSNNLGAMTRTRGRDWFFLRVSDERRMEDDGAKRWCEEATRRLRNVIYSSRANFASAMSQSDHDYVAFGNAIVRHTFNRDQTGLIFSCAHPRDCAWTENEEGFVDEVHEKMHMTLQQIASLFGVEALPPKMREQLQKDSTQKFWVRRIVAPRSTVEHQGWMVKQPRDMRWLSTYILDEGMCPLHEAGFRTFPYLIRRWMTVSGEAYGRSPAAGVALADARTLNVAQASILKSIEWAVDPPKIAVDDGVIGEIRLEAGGITYVDQDAWEPSKGRPIQSLDAGDPRQGMDFMDRGHQRLGRAFFQNLLKLPEREMTAYEAGERIEMYTREAAPIFEPMEADNAILMEGVYERAYYKGLFDDLPPPEIIAGSDVKFEFETPLSIAMRKMRAQQARQAKQSLAESAQLNPEILDNVDWDQMVRDEMEGIGPQKWLRRREDVEAARAARAEQTAQAQEQEAMMRAAEAAAKANPQNLAAAQQGIEEMQAGEQPPLAAGAASGIDWQAMMGGEPALTDGAAPAAMPDMSEMPEMEMPQPQQNNDALASALERALTAQGQMFADALKQLGDKLTAPRVAVRDTQGRIVGSKVEG